MASLPKIEIELNAAIVVEINRLRAGIEKLTHAINSVQSWEGTYVGECMDELEAAMFPDKDNSKVSYHAYNSGGAHGKDTNDK